MTENDRDLPVTRGEAVDLTDAVVELTKRFRWQQRLTAGLIAAFVLVCIALGLGADALVQLRHENACVAGLAAASADRTGVLAPLSTARTNAQDALSAAQSALLLDAISTAGQPPTQRIATLGPDEKAFEAAVVTYRDANTAYQDAVKGNPPPAVPDFHC